MLVGQGISVEEQWLIVKGKLLYRYLFFYLGLDFVADLAFILFERTVAAE